MYPSEWAQKNLFRQGSETDLPEDFFVFLCILLSDDVFKYSMQMYKNFCDDDDDGRNQQSCYTLFSLLHVVVCVCRLIGRVVWDPVAVCMEGWHNNTGSQHLSGSYEEEDIADKLRTGQDFS